MTPGGQRDLATLTPTYDALKRYVTDKAKGIEITCGARGGWFRTFPSGKKFYYRIAHDL